MKTVIFHETGQIADRTTPAPRVARDEKAGIKEECCFKVVLKSGIS